MKTKVMSEDICKQYFSKFIAKTITTTEITDSTIFEVYNKCSDVFITLNSKTGNIIIDEVSNLINFASDKLVFGYKEVVIALKEKSLQKLVINKDLDEKQKNSIKELLYEKCTFAEIEKNMFNGLGEIIGIKFYDNTNISDDDNNSNNEDDKDNNINAETNYDDSISFM
jgi:ribosomal protein L7Ae-like RNA K-turn-binding protein